MMQKFSKIWDTEVKPLAEACIKELEFIKLANKEENYEPTEKEKAYLKDIAEKYKDIYGMLYISDMIEKVEHALADGRKSAADLAISKVYEVLNRPSYFENVFQSNENDEEWKTRAALRDALYNLMYV